MIDDSVEIRLLLTSLSRGDMVHYYHSTAGEIHAECNCRDTGASHCVGCGYGTFYKRFPDFFLYCKPTLSGGLYGTV